MGIMDIRQKIGLPVDVGFTWPPHEASARLERYSTHRKLFTGDHLAVFGKDRQSDTFITCNLAKNIVTVLSDLLFGEDFEIIPASGIEDVPDSIAEFVSRVSLRAMLHESSLDAGYYGDGLIVLSRDEEGKAHAKSVCPDIWFPVLDPDDNRNVLAHRFAWKRESGKSSFLRVSTHSAGKITEEMFAIESNGKIVRAASEAEWAMVYGENIPAPEIETEVDEMLVVHIPNYRTAKDFFGISELSGLESMFDTLDSTLTQIDRILSRHSDPSLGLPADTYRSAKSGDTGWGMYGSSGVIDKKKLDVYMMGENGEKAEYLTWDGQLATNLEFVNLLVRQIANVSETAPQLLGIEQISGAMSGTALKVLLIRTLAKVGRRKRYYDAAIRNILRIAQKIEGDEPVDLKVKWPDGLPQDIREDTEIVAMRLDSGTIDRVSAVMRLDGVDEEAAQGIIDKVDAEHDVTRTSAGLEQSLNGGNPALDLLGITTTPDEF